MLNGMSAYDIATALHTPQSTETLLAVLHDILRRIGGTGAYTLLFTTAEAGRAQVCRSTHEALLPGKLVILPPHLVASSQRCQTPTFLATLHPVGHDNPEFNVGVVAPLWAEGERYGLLLLHETIPPAQQALVTCTAEQLGLALLRVQLHEALQQRHAIDAAKLSAIAETGAVLRELDLDTVLAKLMELALATVNAEVGCIVLRETDDAALVCRVEWGLDGSTLAALRLKAGGTLAETVVQAATPMIAPDLATENPFQPSGLSNRINSLAAIPLTTQRGLFGCLIVVNLTALSEPDIELLRMVAELSSIAIENAVLHQQALEQESLREQLRIAGDIQRGLLPASAPAVKGVTLSAWTLPCDDTGGDYYDFFHLDEQRLGFVVGDVTGHGIGAALMATSVRAFLRTLVQSTNDLCELFERLNNLAEADFTDSKFVTLFLAIYHAQERTLTYASAGHRPPLIIYRHAQDTFEYLKSTGPPLGLFPDIAYEQQVTAPLAVGDVVLLLTDGVVEAFSETQEFFGEERLLSLIRAHCQADPAELIAIIYQAMHDFCGTVPQRDDLTLLCLRPTEA